MYPWISFADSPPLNSARVLLSKLRNGDYTHPGDKEAVDMVVRIALQLAPQIKEGPCLDIGSGLGGTANDLQHFGFRKIYGIDIDQAAVAYAQKQYPQISFITADASKIPTLFEPDSFSFVYLFSVLYAIDDKPTLLQQVHSVTKPGGILAILDYTALSEDFSLKDLAGKPMYPIVLSAIQDNLKASGWEILETIDLSYQFIKWYQNLLHQLSEERSILSQEFSEEDIARVDITFQTLLKWLKSSTLGGVVIFAQKKA